MRHRKTAYDFFILVEDIEGIIVLFLLLLEENLLCYLLLDMLDGLLMATHGIQQHGLSTAELTSFPLPLGTRQPSSISVDVVYLMTGPVSTLDLLLAGCTPDWL